jgi:hypothetical protein
MDDKIQRLGQCFSTVERRMLVTSSGVFMIVLNISFHMNMR